MKHEHSFNLIRRTLYHYESGSFSKLFNRWMLVCSICNQIHLYDDDMPYYLEVPRVKDLELHPDYKIIDRIDYSPFSIVEIGKKGKI